MPPSLGLEQLHRYLPTSRFLQISMGAGLKTLSSKEVITILGMFGFVVHSQKSSHIKLRRETAAGKETLMVPERKQIATGTLREIFKQASAYIPQAELRPHFFND